MESNISSRSSSPEPQSLENQKINEFSANSLKTKNDEISEKKKRKVPPRTEKQLEALRKGMAKLKENREKRAQEKEDRKRTNEELKAKGLPPIEPPVKLKKSEVVELKPAKLETAEIVVKERKPRWDKGMKKAEKDPMDKPITKREMQEMKSLIGNLKPSEKVVEKEVVREVPVERVVEKTVEKVLTGSALLDKIFFNK